METRQERALRRAQQLHNAFQTAFEVLAEIYRDEDWKFINDAAGRPYSGFTAFVQDQMGCAASNARRYQQAIPLLPTRIENYQRLASLLRGKKDQLSKTQAEALESAKAVRALIVP
mgnify:CR=1 FL=1